MNMKETQLIAKVIQDECAKAYEDGIRYAIEYLSDLYDGIEETDIYAEYMKESAK